MTLGADDRPTAYCVHSAGPTAPSPPLPALPAVFVRRAPPSLRLFGVTVGFVEIGCVCFQPGRAVDEGEGI